VEATAFEVRADDQAQYGGANLHRPAPRVEATGWSGRISGWNNEEPAAAFPAGSSRHDLQVVESLHLATGNRQATSKCSRE
jgi:hypothetical protein